jgi:hypothetical protein
VRVETRACAPTPSRWKETAADEPPTTIPAGRAVELLDRDVRFEDHGRGGLD